MAVGASLAALLVLLLVAAAFGYDVRAIPHRIAGLVQRRPPVFGWVQSDDRTFSFLAGEGKAWGPIDPQQGDIVPIAVISLVLAFIATIYPSWRASRLQPAEALRYE